MNKDFKYKNTVGIESTNPKDMPKDHSEIPVWNSENWFYEDVIIDHKIRSLRRTISEGEAMQFNCMVLDMHPYVGDEHFAKNEGLFKKRLVAGAMVFSYGLGLVATNCVNSFSYGYDRLRFIKPVFIGDTIYTIRKNMEKKPKYEKMGLVRTSYEVFKGEGEIVLYCEHLHSVLYKKPEDFKDKFEKMTTLKGMTWDHSRGYDPMIATSKNFAERYNNEVSIKWDKRSLQAFADRPIEQMVEEYDLMVIDYPHVGEVSAKGLLQNFDIEKYNNELELLQKQSVGLSHQSYNIDGHQWALALDAATQVSCYRNDLITSLPKSWDDLLQLSQNNKVIWPLKPVHAISSFYSIYNNITEVFEPNNKNFIQKDFGVKTLQMMKLISQYLPSECFGMDPIKTAEILSEHNEFFYSPYTYGFSNYSRTGYRKNLLTYGNVIDLSGKGPCGTHLGGTGIAISNKSKNKELALEYSYWIAGSECQQTIFYTSGGQPGNSDAWENNNINLETNNFFKNTRLTLDQAWIRPRHNGYMKFQDESGNIINEYLQSNVNEVNVIDKLKLMYAESFEE